MYITDHRSRITDHALRITNLWSSEHVATNLKHILRDFVELAFSAVGLDRQEYVKMDERFMRPADVPELRGDASKARAKLGWKPETSFEELVKMMVRADVEGYEKKSENKNDV